MIENNRIEYKRELTDSLEKEVVAFLNSRLGGAIYIGVDDSGKPVPLADIDSLQLKIKDRLKNNISPSVLGLFDIVVEKIYQQNVIKVIIASGSEKPYYLSQKGMSSKGCFTRVGSASEPMSGKLIEELFSKRVRNSIGKIRSPYQDLTFEQLKIYYNEKGLTLNDRFARTLELLTEENLYNYGAYLLSDENGCSIKVAKYSGTDRVDLVENEEYGYCSLVKAAKAVEEKLKIENKTFTKITGELERKQKRMIDPVALREALINAIVHNDYSSEVPPKFELFSDRLEITSKGGVPLELSEEEFLSGVSHPVNKMIMRVFRDLDMTEQLGSGVPRILKNYNEKIYHFSENFIRVIFYFEDEFMTTPQVTPQATPQATPKATMHAEKVLLFCIEPRKRDEIQEYLGLMDREYFRLEILNPLIREGKIALTLPDKPRSPNQKYITVQKDERCQQ